MHWVGNDKGAYSHVFYDFTDHAAILGGDLHVLRKQIAAGKRSQVRYLLWFCGLLGLLSLRCEPDNWRFHFNAPFDV